MVSDESLGRDETHDTYVRLAIIIHCEFHDLTNVLTLNAHSVIIPLEPPSHTGIAEGPSTN